jgi:hypothetical protein
MKAYVVTMHRWGDHENHSYVLGVWSYPILARSHGLTEESLRGGKYKHEVTEWVIDAEEPEDYWKEEV